MEKLTEPIKSNQIEDLLKHISEFLSFISNVEILTLLIALATFWTVWEMRKGRIQSIKPQLILLPPIIKYDFRWIPLENLAVIVRPEERSTQEITRLPIFYLKNIGSAPAQSIILEWSISDLQDVISKVLNSETLMPYSPNKNDEFITLTRKKNDGKESVGVPLRNIEYVKVPYSIASPNSEINNHIIIPDGILNSICYEFISKERSNTFLDRDEASTILVKIKYYDLVGKKDQSTFLITPILYITHDSVGSTTNSVDEIHRSDSNLRGTLTFKIVPVSNRINRRKSKKKL